MPARNQRALFEIRNSSIHGLGAFATRRIKKSTRVIEYLGERITHEEADRRYDDELGDYPHVLLFTVNKKIVIDAGVGGNEAKYINHSCEPNCEAVTESGRVFIVTLRTISTGEELTYDYRLERPEDCDPEWEARYACQCGTRTCRGTMLAPLDP
jgi:SET domain-containing protein